MPTQNVNVTERIASFVKNQVASGTYKNISEVHRAALIKMEREEEERQIRIERLKIEAQKGSEDIEAGRYIELNSSKKLREYMDGVLADVLNEENVDAEPV